MSPLDELSELLGVRVVGFDRSPPPRAGEHDLFGRPLRRGWSVRVDGSRGYSQLPSSDELR
jgi:hypothetical protein